MNIKDSSKLLFDLLEKEYNQKIQEVEQEANKTRIHILKKYEDLANLHSKQITNSMLTESKLKLNQELQIAKSESMSKLSKEKEEMYKEILFVLKQKIMNLQTKEKQKIIKKMLEDIKKQTTSEYKIINWFEKNSNDLKLTAESKTEYIEDSIDIRLENSKEQIYKIINLKVN